MITAKHLVCASALLVFIGGIAQPYCPIPDSNAFWKEVYVFFMPGNPYNTLQDEYVNGDTVVGSYVYTKVYTSGRTTSNSDTTYFNGMYMGAVRDDSANRQVYFIRASDTTEQLVYDYSLSIGQLTPVSSVFPNQYAITGIDSIYFLNRWHRRLRTSEYGPAGWLELIEGIGSTYGLTLCYCSSLQRMFCYYQDDRPCWPDTLNGCATEVRVHEPNARNILTIAPNPAHTYLSIRFATNTNGNIFIFNRNGQPVSMIAVENKESCEVDISPFSPGLYLLEFVGSDRTSFSQKFIVE